MVSSTIFCILCRSDSRTWRNIPIPEARTERRGRLRPYTHIGLAEREAVKLLGLAPNMHTRHVRLHTGGVCEQTGHVRSHTGGVCEQTGHVRSHTGRVCKQTGHVRSHTGRVCKQTGRVRSHTGRICCTQSIFSRTQVNRVTPCAMVYPTPASGAAGTRV